MKCWSQGELDKCRKQVAFLLDQGWIGSAEAYAGWQLAEHGQTRRRSRRAQSSHAVRVDNRAGPGRGPALAPTGRAPTEWFAEAQRPPSVVRRRARVPRGAGMGDPLRDLSSDGLLGGLFALRFAPSGWLGSPAPGRSDRFRRAGPGPRDRGCRRMVESEFPASADAHPCGPISLSRRPVSSHSISPGHPRIQKLHSRALISPNPSLHAKFQVPCVVKQDTATRIRSKFVPPTPSISESAV